MLNLTKLNQEQQQAVTYGEGPLLILAGPGSGKTTVVLQRIFYLIQVKKIPPEKILVLTFTKDAAVAMQSRFQEESKQTLPITFGTFHSIFYQILIKSHITNTNQIMSKPHKNQIIYPILKKYQKERTYLSAEELLSVFSYYKNTGDLLQAKNRLAQEWQNCFLNMFQEYEKQRKSRRELDYDDMVYECLELLQNNNQLRRYWSRRFDYILIDEFQDINPIQYKVIKQLAKAPYSLFCVGDDDQGIYGFRGASTNCMMQLEKDYQAHTITLHKNYRSTNEIVKISLKMVEENVFRFKKEMQAAMEESAPKSVELIGFPDIDEQNQFIYQQLLAQRDEDCAILFRTNLQLQRFASFLRRNGMMYLINEKEENLYDHFIVKDIFAYLQLAGSKWEREKLLRIMNKPYRGILREHILENKDNLENKTNIAYESLRKQIANMKNMPLYLAVNYIRKVIGYEQYLKELEKKQHRNDLDWMERLEWITQEAKAYSSLTEWMEHMNNKKIRFPKENKTNEEIIKPKLMTVHKAKGLEFNRVWIPDCNEGVYPYGTLQEKEECEEERRILYVAMTRAKRSLNITYIASEKKDFKLPSRFLNKLLKDYSSTNSSNSQSSKY